MTTEPQILNNHCELEGVPIGVAEAARKYGIPQPTISRWAMRGLVKVLRRPERNGQKMDLDESSVALAADLYHRNPGQGQDPLKPLKQKIASRNMPLGS